MPPKSVTLAAFLPAQLKPPEQVPEPAQLPNGQPRPQRCRCEGPFDLCWRYPAGIANAACKQTWDKLLAPFQFKGREWTIVELRSLWPHTVQALNERLQKGRMERTLKEDLQDDLQVLVDLIQHSCKPHPRPPRAGMKTLIVQGRILAEAIAQDALFQLDPVDRAAPRPDRDLVDLINRLRDHHPNSLLAPALHVLRTLGNTAVHLDRDSARLTDGEIGDAAAVCCRFVVLVVDVYMQMCANLHKHEETEAALAQPLLEVPVAPIPAPNVLLRPRDPTPPRPPLPEEVPTAAALGGATAAARAAVPSPPPMPSASMAAHAMLRVASRTTVPDDDVSPAMAYGGSAAVTAAHRDSGGGSSSGGRRSFPGCADGSGRVPYSLVSSDWSAAPQHTHMQPSSSGGGDGSGGNGGDGGRGRSLMSRCWWPSAVVNEAPAAPPSPVPPTLLRRPEASAQSPVSGLGSPSVPPPQPQLSPQLLTATASGAHWLQDQYGLIQGSYGSQGTIWAATTATSTNHLGQRRLSGGADGVDAGSQSERADGVAAAVAATVPASSQPPFTRTLAQDAYHPLPSQSTTDTAAADFAPGHGMATPSILAEGIVCSAPGPTDAAAPAALAPQIHTDSWVSAEPSRPAGSSPRRFPISLTSGEAVGGDPALAMAFAGGSGLAVRGSSPAPVRHGPRQPAPQPLFNHHHRQQEQPLQQQQEPQQLERVALNGVTTTGAGPGAGCSGGGLPMGPNEASKRLLQLCAVAQTPMVSKVEKLLQAGATLTFTDKSGMTALHLACYWCHVEAARLLLDRQPTAAAATDREGRTPLWVASQRGHVEIVGMLLALTEGAMQVDIANAAGVTPLRVSAAQGHSQVVAALLWAGANVELADKDGFTPLYVAAARNQLEVVRLLLAASAPVDRPDKAQRTPLWAALHPGGAARAEASPERRAAVVRALLDRGADVYLLADARDREYCWQVLAQSIAEGG